MKYLETQSDILISHETYYIVLELIDKNYLYIYNIVKND